MIQRKLVFCIDNNINFVSGSIPATKLTANDINRDVIYVVAPFEISSVIKVKFADELNQQENVSQLLKYTNEVSVDELVEKTKPYYETVKDWNVYYIEMSGKPLSFVSNRISTGIYISFSVVITKPKTNLVSGLNFVGYEYGTSLETPLNNGEYKIIRNPLFEEGGVSYNVDDIIYKENDNYFRVSSSVRKGGTTGIKYLVEPNVSAIDESLDPTLTEQIIEMVTDLEQDVAHISRNAILKDGSVAMEDDLDLGGNSLIGVDKISATAGDDIEMVSDVEMNNNDIKGVGNITTNNLDVNSAYIHRANVDVIEGNNSEEISIDEDVVFAPNKVLGVDEIHVKNIRSKAENGYIEVLDQVDMNGKGIYGAGEFEGEFGTFNVSLTKGGKEVATIEYVDGMISGVFRPSGNWNANTNTPTLANNDPTNAGKVYYVTDAGTQFGLTFAVGDKLAFIEGGVATKWDNVDDVVSVNSKVGAVQLNADDIPFNGSGTNYLTAKTEVEGAVKELDTRVKANADNVALKVNTSDIVDDLVSSDVDKPLSAKQGKVLNDTTAKLAVSNVFTQPQQVPNATLPQHTTNLSQVETMFEMFKQQLRGYNFAIPDLSTATDLGDGWYETYSDDTFYERYNIYTGEFIRNGETNVNGVINTVSFKPVPLGLTYTSKINYISGEIVGSSNQGFKLPVSDIGADGYLYFNRSGFPSHEKTYVADNTVTRIHINATKVTYNNYTFTIQTTLGEEETPYTVPGQIPQYEIVENKLLTTITLDDWEVGTFTGVGEPDDRNDRIRSIDFHDFDFKKLIITPEDGYKAGVYRYSYVGDDTYTFIDYIEMTPEQTIIDVGDYFYKFLIASNDNAPANVDFSKKIIISGDDDGENKPTPASSFEFTLTDDVEDKSNSSGSPLTNIDTDTMYSLFDALMIENQRYISKNQVGYGSDSEGLEDENSPIFEYVVSPYQGAPNSGLTESLPTIIIVCGVHGNEKASTWAVYEMLKKMFNGNVGFNQIRANCKLKIIPILNRYGFDNNSRTNAAGTDINRTFSNLSTFEAKVLSDWMKANEDALAFIDYHNTANHGWYTYLLTSDYKTREMYSSLVRTLAPIWETKYGFDVWSQAENEDRFVFTRGHISSGSSYHALNVAKIKNSVTLEIGNYDPNSSKLYTKTVLETAVDLLANWLLSLLRKYYY